MPRMRPSPKGPGASVTTPGMAPEAVAPTRPTRYPASHRSVAGSVAYRGARERRSSDEH
jgi:hypothetical protein